MLLRKWDQMDMAPDQFDRDEVARRRNFIFSVLVHACCSIVGIGQKMAQNGWRVCRPPD
jgi:hypothetical protein